MRIAIDESIFERFPDARVGWMTADVEVLPSHPHVDGMKNRLAAELSAIGISADTMMMHPDLQRWREVYSMMGVKPSKFKSSPEALLRRLFKGDLWNVSSVVDCYNCVSARNLLSLGAYDMSRICGDLTLRYAKEGEKFLPLGAGESIIETEPRQVVYADGEKICCWLWNHRDTREASVSPETKRALFIVDSAFANEYKSVEEGLSLLEEELIKLGASILKKGISDAGSPVTEA